MPAVLRSSGRLALVVTWLVLGSNLTGPVAAQTLVNGDLDGVADLTMYNAVIPPGWAATSGSVDLMDSTSTPGNVAWLPSTGGGTFVHAQASAQNPEAFEQLVTGLVPGQVYTLTFEQTITNSLFVTDTAGRWRVSFGPDTLDSSLMNVPALGTPVPWSVETMHFTAVAASQVLRFAALSGTPGPPPLSVQLGVDTVRVELGCGGPTVPGLEGVVLGAPPNPFALMPSTTGPPQPGQVWDPYIDHTSFVPNATLDLYAFHVVPANVPVPFVGTLLCQWPPLFTQQRLPTDSLNLPLPYDCAFVGERVCLQGISVDPFGFLHLTNSLEVTIGSP